jgi:hypothetical protein
MLLIQINKILYEPDTGRGKTTIFFKKQQRVYKKETLWPVHLVRLIWPNPSEQARFQYDFWRFHLIHTRSLYMHPFFLIVM